MSSIQITVDEPTRRRLESAATRPMFQRASDLFGQGSKNIQAIIDDSATDIARKKSLVRDSMQAELERGINQFNLADAYISPEGQEAVQRGAALDAAKAIFLTLGKKDTNSPISWSARAWAAACDVEKTDTKAAEDAFKQIRIDATKSPASGDGVRMVEFFEAQNNNSRFIMLSMMTGNCHLGLSHERMHPTFALNRVESD